MCRKLNARLNWGGGKEEEQHPRQHVDKGRLAAARGGKYPLWKEYNGVEMLRIFQIFPLHKAGETIIDP